MTPMLDNLRNNRKRIRGGRPAKPRSTSTLRSINTFFESKVGSAILTFLLTVVLGTILTTGFASWQSSREIEREKRNQENSKHVQTQRFVSEQLANRRLTVGLLSSGLAHRLEDDDISRRFTDYEKAYTLFNKMFFVFRDNLDDLKERRFHGKNHFSDVLESKIIKSFSRLDRCVTIAYSERQKIYQQGSHKISFPKISLLEAGSLECGVKSDGSTWTSKSEIDNLSHCLGTFRAELDGRIDLIRMSRNSESIFPWSSDIEKMKSANWEAMPEKLHAGCKELDEMWYDLAEFVRYNEQKYLKACNSILRKQPIHFHCQWKWPESLTPPKAPLSPRSPPG